jgi:Zn-finger protein
MMSEKMLSIELMPRLDLPFCAWCHCPLTPDNFSGWDAFVEGKDGIEYCAPICIACFDEDANSGPQMKVPE